MRSALTGSETSRGAMPFGPGMLGPHEARPVAMSTTGRAVRDMTRGGSLGLAVTPPLALEISLAVLVGLPAVLVLAIVVLRLDCIAPAVLVRQGLPVRQIVAPAHQLLRVLERFLLRAVGVHDVEPQVTGPAAGEDDLLPVGRPGVIPFHRAVVRQVGLAAAIDIH